VDDSSQSSCSTPESDHFLTPETPVLALVEELRGQWRRPPSYAWVLGRRSSHKAALPPPEHDAWWDALEAAEGALGLLADKRCWTGKDVRAAVGFARWGKRRAAWRPAMSRHGVDSLNERAVKWTALGALEKASGCPDGAGVQLALEVARRAAKGRPLALVEELEGYQGMMGVLRRVVGRIRRVVEGACRRRRKRRRGARLETRVSNPRCAAAA
jgi:hypothetical protein